MEMKTMFEIEFNEFNEEIEIEYLVPLQVVEQYLIDSGESKDNVNHFLSEVYNSEDTSNIIDECMRNDLPFELVAERLINEY